MNQPTVTFGKYKGQPMSILISDKLYLKWCQQQTWFQEKYPNLCDTTQADNTKPFPVCETSTIMKIRYLEEENATLKLKIKSNQSEIQRLNSNCGGDVNQGGENDIFETPIKCIGKCLL